MFNTVLSTKKLLLALCFRNGKACKVGLMSFSTTDMICHYESGTVTYDVIMYVACYDATTVM